MDHKKVTGVVEYFSTSLQGVQNNYPAEELELLRIIESLRHFKYLLHGKRSALGHLRDRSYLPVGPEKQKRSNDAANAVDHLSTSEPLQWIPDALKEEYRLAVMHILEPKNEATNLPRNETVSHTTSAKTL